MLNTRVLKPIKRRNADEMSKNIISHTFKNFIALNTLSHVRFREREELVVKKELDILEGEVEEGERGWEPSN